jgi:hypothetical protein
VNTLKLLLRPGWHLIALVELALAAAGMVYILVGAVAGWALAPGVVIGTITLFGTGLTFTILTINQMRAEQGEGRR